MAYGVSLFPDTDLTLTTERLVELFASMFDGYVDCVGVKFDTPDSKIQQFQMNYQNPAQRMEAYWTTMSTTIQQHLR